MMVIQEEEEQQQVSSSLSILEEEDKCQQQQQLSATSSTVSQSPTTLMAQEEEEADKESNNCTVTKEDNEAMNNDYDGGSNDNNNGAATTNSSVPAIQEQSNHQRRSSNTIIINPYKKQTPTATATATNDDDNNNNDPRNQKRRQFIEKYRLQSLNYCHRSGINNKYNNINHYHHHRARGGSGGVVDSSSRANNTSSSSSLLAAESTSAMEVYRSHQQWRMQWRKRQSSSAVKDDEQKQQQQRQEEQEEQISQQEGRSCANQNGSNNKVNSSTRRRRGFGECALKPRLFLFQKHMLAIQNNNSDSTTSHQHYQQQEGIWELGTGITEISGEGGSGKTQICLSLCMSCVLTPLLFPANESQQQQQQRLHGNANDESSYYTSIYITMGEGIPQSKIASRLHEMLRDRRRHCSTNFYNNQGSNETEEQQQQQQILSRIWLLSLKNEDDFIEFVEVHLPNILTNQVCGSKPSSFSSSSSNHETNDQYPVCSKIGLVAFDGIANFFRFSDPLFQQNATATTMNNQRSMFHQHRSSKLFQISSLLRQFSDLYDVPIVITNQVTSVIPSDDGLVKGGGRGHSTSSTFASTAMGGMQNKIQPALGLIWSNCVTTRFILQRKDGVVARISHGSKNTGTTSSEGNEKSTKAPTTTMQRSVRKATVLQSVCTPEESEVWYIIDTGAVVTV
ncbi:hypothetical protein ACHAWC_004090 [Mediolabrus comicus]